MSDAQPDLARALGAAAGVGLLAMVTGRAKPPSGLSPLVLRQSSR
jgi:hypothetical protein